MIGLQMGARGKEKGEASDLEVVNTNDLWFLTVWIWTALPPDARPPPRLKKNGSPARNLGQPEG